MKIGVCAAGKVGRELVEFVLNYPHPVAFVATHKDDAAHASCIWRQCQVSNVPCIKDAEVNSDNFVQTIRESQIDAMLLLWWPTIIKRPAIDAARVGWINLHPSLLPYGRGKHPYYWAINEGTPYGVTIHFIDETVDGGGYIAQREIPHDITDTGESLYRKALIEIVDLFKEVYPEIVKGDFSTQLSHPAYPVHYSRMLEPHSEISLDDSYVARDLINRVRGRTFLQGDSAHFYENGLKYRIKVIIEEAK
jgi:methionyl-tRNA formyltransferase